jgi:hypothetical protein
MIPAADTRLYAVDAPGGAPALLFLSGGFGTVQNWSRVIRRLDRSTAWCGSTRGRHLPGVEVNPMGSLEAAEIVVVAAEHVGRPREELEILRTEGSGSIGGR